MKDSDNTPLGSVELTLTDAYNNFVNATTNSSGAYSIAVRPGLYSLKIEGDNIPGMVDFNLEHTPITPSIDLSSGSVSQDLVVPVGIIDVTTYNAQGNTFAYPRIKAYTGLINSPISLAASNYDFNVTGGNYRLYGGNLGVGSFKSIVGMSYTGVGSSNTVCSYDDMSSVTPVTCSLPFTVTTGVNPITLNQVPTP